MRFLSRIALLSLLLSVPAQAQDIEIKIGTGLICNTQQQVEQLLAQFDGTAGQPAGSTGVEANDDICVVATVAYVRGPTVATARTKNGTYHIVRVLVVGVFTDAGLEAAIPEPFFSLTKVEEQDA
jgi:hypothetical protein